MTSAKDDAVRSIVKQWNGGEHILAGARASELIYGSSNKADEKVQKAIVDGAPGIERYITAPTAKPVTQVDDQGGNPMARQPENRKEATGESNVSNEQGKDEQDRIDAELEAGRKAREQAGAQGDVGSTKLNPAGSDEKPSGDTAKPNTATVKAKVDTKQKANKAATAKPADKVDAKSA
ncbi:hypothetical protein J2S28_001641 [Rhizobium sp. SLBN-94]|nr:hypothetical protein [Rhizobium sp. SLBN-94]